MTLDERTYMYFHHIFMTQQGAQHGTPIRIYAIYFRSQLKTASNALSARMMCFIQSSLACVSNCHTFYLSSLKDTNVLFSTKRLYKVVFKIRLSDAWPYNSVLPSCKQSRNSHEQSQNIILNNKLRYITLMMTHQYMLQPMMGCCGLHTNETMPLE